MKHLFLLFILITIKLNAQEIDIENFNKKYLEHLVKVKIDNVRKTKDCNPLYNDSILYIASQHHSNYMNINSKLTHFEKSDSMKSPLDRVNYFGKKNSLVGENVIEVPIYTSVKNKKGKSHNTKTYEGLANSIVDGWVYSPGHYKNIITPEYQTTGLSIAINKIENKIYACQKFAQIPYEYEFIESKTLFSYSELPKLKVKNDFKDIPFSLQKHEHLWDLKHDNKKKCIECEQLTNTPPQLTLRVNDRNQFILRIENSDYVKKLMNNKDDGFAVEIVEYNQYSCGNPKYFTKPSRRNKQCELNGKPIEPVYRNQLIKGYKKRKVNKDIKYLSYIIGADSIPFLNRFYGYKVNRFSSAYFEINLGKVPKDINGLWAYNLIYIQDKQICHIDYFTGYCGEQLSDYFPPRVVSPDTNYYYSFLEDTVNFTFIIPFEKNKYDYSIEDIEPFLKTINDNKITIDSLSIMAFSSVEGDSINNNILQRKRANNILKSLKGNQQQEIESKVEVKNSWDHFYKAIKKSRKWNFLANKEQSEILKLLNTTYRDSLETILKEERKADINVKATVDLTDENLAYYIKKRNKELCDSIGNFKENDIEIAYLLCQVDTLYGFTYKMLKSKKVKPITLANLRLPDYYNSNISLTEKFILYGLEYSEEFNNNDYWKEHHKKIRQGLINKHLNKVSELFIYTDCVYKTMELHKQPKVTQEEVQAVFNELESLNNYYQESEKNVMNIDIINFDLNFILVNKVFANEPTAKSEDAQKSVVQMIKFYEKHNLYDSKKALELAKLAVFYDNITFANTILAQFIDEDIVLAYTLPLAYQHVSSELSEVYYQYLIQKSKEMDSNIWCNMFFAECGIPFQAFDHEKLRNVFCEKCKDKNQFLIELMK